MEKSELIHSSGSLSSLSIIYIHQVVIQFTKYEIKFLPYDEREIAVKTIPLKQ